ncbi:hypothetical protein Q5762_01680 [Streptomyces sp. P9(2023)]|nr:hypothetical protein [Streptomyces sp. P9(2023)]
MLTVPAAVAVPGAVSAPSAGTSQVQDGVARMEFNSEVLSAGTAGFLSENEGTGDPIYWTSYADGTTSRIGFTETVGGDLYLEENTRSAVNMATGATFTLPGSNTDAMGIAGRAVFTTLSPESGATLWTHTATASRQVTGLPAGAKRATAPSPAASASAAAGAATAS